MVVPDHELRERRVEAADVVVEQVVAIVAPELGERLGHLALLFGHQVPPHAPIVEPDLGDERVVGVDRVAGVDEDVGAGLAHRVVEPHPAHPRIDAPALPDGIGAPRDRHVAKRAARRRRGERPRHRLARDAQILQALERGPVEDALAGRQALQVDAGREIARFERRGTDDTAGVGERFGGRVFDDEPRVAIGAAPDDRAVDVDVARSNAKCGRRPEALRRHDGRRLAEESVMPAPRVRAQGCARAGRDDARCLLEKCAPGVSACGHFADDLEW